MTVELSAGLLKLLQAPAYCQLGIVMPDGSPQVTQVWVESDGVNILINTAQGRQKTLNVERDPRVAVHVIDPAHQFRYASIRGKVIEITTEGADEGIDRLAKQYLGVDVYPFHTAAETRVIFKIAPERINSMGLD